VKGPCRVPAMMQLLVALLSQGERAVLCVGGLPYSRGPRAGALVWRADAGHV
jgi:hypothetical protein